MKTSSFVLAVVVAAGLFSGVGVQAKPVTPDEAVAAARGWLAVTDAGPMEKRLGSGLAFMRTGLDENGQTLFYAFYLEEGGMVVLSPDDSLDPVVAFSDRPADFADPSPCNHLRLLLEKDMASQLMDVRAGEVGDAAVKASKWALLWAAARDPEGIKAGLGSVSDVRVKPLITTRWSQSYVYQGRTKLTCYNYYTPKQYVCGCVATAYAQLMRYYKAPRNGPGTPAYTISINGTARVRNLRGGNGAGGKYDWAHMPNDPAALARVGQLTTTQRMAIGALCHDAGVAASMSYGPLESSAVYNGYALFNPFGYVFDGGYTPAGNVIPRSAINNFVNSNLDAGMPCGLSLQGEGRHAVLVDGYGYTYGTLYHHLNMGWGGNGDAWYKLPKVGSNPSFSAVVNYIYNIWPAGRGGAGICSEGAHHLFVVSGRVMSFGGTKPMAGVKVVAKNPPTGMSCAPTNDVVAVTDANGNYVMKVPYDLHWYIRPEVPGAGFEPESYDQHCCLWKGDFTRVTRILRFSPQAIAFGALPVGGYTNAPLTIYNDGSGTLTISQVQSSFSGVSPSPPYTIAPKRSTTVTVGLVRYSDTQSPFQLVFNSNSTKGTNAVTVSYTNP